MHGCLLDLQAGASHREYKPGSRDLGDAKENQRWTLVKVARTNLNLYIIAIGKRSQCKLNTTLIHRKRVVEHFQGRREEQGRAVHGLSRERGVKSYKKWEGSVGHMKHEFAN